MRNAVVGLGILLLVIGSYVVLTNMGLSHAEVADPVGSVSELDIRGYEGRPMILDGPWNFFPDTFIDPADVPTSGYETLSVPGSWDGGISHGSYHVRLKGVEQGRHALWIDTVYTAYELYVDGRFLAGSGRISADGVGSVAQFSDNLCQFDVTGEDAVDIVLLVSNHYHPRGGIGIAPIFGAAPSVSRLYWISTSTSVALVVLFLVCAVIILFFHGRLNPDRSIIMFSIFCIALAVKVASSNTLFTLYFPHIPIGLVSKFEYITIPIAAMAYLKYAQDVYALRISTWVNLIFQSLSYGYVLLILVAPISFYNPLLTPYTIMMVLMMALLLVLLLLGKFLWNKVSGMIVLSAVVMLLSLALQTYFYDHGTVNIYLNQVAALGTAFFVLANFEAFSYRFLLANQAAQNAADVLEEKVSQRTKELHEANDRLIWSASHDALTSLLNRNELIRTYMGRAYGPPFATAYMDLDNFKMINDHFTHNAGDIVLRLFGEHLQGHVRATDTIFRVGGDEFVILLPDTDLSGAHAFAERMFVSLEDFCIKTLQQLAKEMEFIQEADAPCTLTVSMGVAVQESGRINLDTLIQRSDELLLRSKSDGKDRYLIDMIPPS